MLSGRDITAFKASVVPVGEDQAPIIEQTNEIVRRINRQAGRDMLPEARVLVPAIGRLPGVDGQAKMSKSQGNAILLSASDAEITAAVYAMYTDPGHLRAGNPGRVEGNVVFSYLDAFDGDRDAVADLKVHYRRGSLGDMMVKHRLDAVLRGTVGSIRERRAALARDPGFHIDVLRAGTSHACDVTAATQAEVHAGLGLFTLP